MGCFPLCPRCSVEYTDPKDRRFHAEPVCCPDCGPRLRLVDSSSVELGQGPEALEHAGRALRDGLIIAVKGLGGFQLACRADLTAAVERLRNRKRRPTKPFAVMVADLEAARRLVTLSQPDEELLTSARCPILLAPRQPGESIAANVAPGMEDLGIVLPTTPLHLLLFRELGNYPLVMTSGNASDEPICKGNREALDRLGTIADLFLIHDRDVVRRVDDSVARSSSDGPFLVRRARGWVPEPLTLPENAPAPLLAVGAHLQVTAAVAREAQVVLTPHVGDLDTEQARTFLREAIDHLEGLLEIRAEILVADAHPDYPSRWLAEELVEQRGGRLITVQHHLAHAAAVLAEHGRFPSPGETALVLTLDGTGWGPTHSAWGGEWLVVHGDLSWQRAGQLEPMVLVGGEAAVQPRRRVGRHHPAGERGRQDHHLGAMLRDEGRQGQALLPHTETHPGRILHQEERARSRAAEVLGHLREGIGLRLPGGQAEDRRAVDAQRPGQPGASAGHLEGDRRKPFPVEIGLADGQAVAGVIGGCGRERGGLGGGLPGGLGGAVQGLAQSAAEFAGAAGEIVALRVEGFRPGGAPGGGVDAYHPGAPFDLPVELFQRIG